MKISWVAVAPVGDADGGGVEKEKAGINGSKTILARAQEPDTFIS
jgi:hypothetical protein